MLLSSYEYPPAYDIRYESRDHAHKRLVTLQVNESVAE